MSEEVKSTEEVQSAEEVKMSEEVKSTEEVQSTEEVKSHLFAIRTTGGQEKVVMRLLEAKAKADKINIQSVLLVDNLKGYVNQSK